MGSCSSKPHDFQQAVGADVDWGSMTFDVSHDVSDGELSHGDIEDVYINKGKMDGRVS